MGNRYWLIAAAANEDSGCYSHCRLNIGYYNAIAD